MSQTSSTESRALALLGQNLDPKVVASATGVSVSRISQLLSDPEFADQVAELRYKNLSAATERDDKYNKLEDQLLEKLEESLYAFSNPAMILKGLKVVNDAQRRGATAPAQIEKQAETVTLTMPVTILNQFVTNVNNQVIKAGLQELVTVQSSQMNSLLKASHEPVLLERIP